MTFTSVILIVKMSNLCNYLIVHILDVPIFPTVTAVVTLEKFEPRQTSAEKFLIPRDYRKFEVC